MDSFLFSSSSFNLSLLHFKQQEETGRHIQHCLQISSLLTHLSVIFYVPTGNSVAKLSATT